MPGKTPAKMPGTGKDTSTNSSADLSGGKANKYCIWPKWTDDEPLPDKRESSKPGGGDAASRARKGTAISAGQVDVDKSSEDNILPPSLSKGDVQWVQPGQFIVAPRIPAVVAEPIPEEIDLTSENTHLLKSELMCSIISQLHALWHNRSSPHLTTATSSSSSSKGEPDEAVQEWRPWDHIQHKKEHKIPMFNPQGTYGVKIFWMGSWRKITVTDHLPVVQKKSASTSTGENQEAPPSDSLKDGEDGRKEAKGGESRDGENFESGEVLLPRTANTCELWPAILTKAILKVAALDYKGGSEWTEFGECSVIHMLTGWCPQTLTTRIESDLLWEVLCHSLPLWKRPSEAEGVEDRGGGEHLEEGGGGEEEGREGERDTASRMVTAQFTSAANGKPLTRAKETIMIEAVKILKANGVVSEQFDPRADHAQCVFVRQIRDIPLQPPPKVPPPIPAPEEHAWLGYRFREYEPWKGERPKPLPPRWVELVTPFPTGRAPTDSSNTHYLEEEEEEEEREGEEQHPPEGGVARETEAAAEDGGGGSATTGGASLERQTGIWMKFEEFRKAFSCVEVHTPQSQFKFTQTYKDMTATVEMATQEETKAKGRASHSPANKLKGAESNVADDTNILFLEEDESGKGSRESGENPRGVELHFVLSCLSNWREGSRDLKTERRKSMALQRRRVSILANPINKRYSFNYHLPAGGHRTSASPWTGGRAPPFTIPEEDEDASSVGSAVHLPPTPPEEEEEEEEEEVERVVGGVLVVEEFNWKTIATTVPLLRLATSGVKGATIKVNRRQQMLKFHVKAPVGYHLSISSNNNFVLYNENAAYDRMHKEGIGYSKVYSGPIQPLPPDSWAVVFREVLQTRRDQQLLAFSLDCPVPGHQLRVVDNDDGREMPRVAHITEPQEYSINKKGYTILCEMWTRSDAVTEGNNWKLRVISSERDLPLCEGLEREEEEEEEEEGDGQKAKEEEQRNKEGGGGEEKEAQVAEVVIPTEFHHKEVRDYCLPDRESVLFRYSLRAKTECPITAQLTTSKRDAHIKLEIFQGSEFDRKLVAVTQGRAYCFIPSFLLLPPPNEESDQPAQKFVMVATVLHNSWPFADTAWPYIDEIRSAEEEKASVSGGAGGGGGKGKKPASASSKGSGSGKSKKAGGKGGGGGGKDGGGKESSAGVQSSSSLSNIDGSKPHWTLRVAIRQADKEQFKMTRDTEREDELKSMQTTWETQQPGRLKKGQESRQKFLEAHALKPPPNTNSEDQQHVPSTTSLSSSTTPLPTSPSLLPPHAPVPLERIDLSLYTRNSQTAPHVLTAEERERRDEERKESIRQYRAWRQSVLRSRDEDRQFRNNEKVRQLQEAEKQQTELEASLKRMNRGREKIRQVYLAEEKARREAEQAALKAAEEEAAASNARDSKAKGKKGKKK